MIRIILIIVATTYSLGSQPSLTTYGPLSSEIILHGRYYSQGNSVAYDWRCFRIDFCFEQATKVIWKVVDTWNIYHVVTDGNSTLTVHPKHQQSIILFESTTPQSHCLQIIKITENHYGPIASHRDSLFNGIDVEGGKLVKNTKDYDYKFEFMGDSLTTAFGVMSGRNPICFLNMKNIQNCQLSWGVQLSKMFNAEYRIQAVSGTGVVMNSIGVPGKRMPTLFSRVTDNSAQNSYKLGDNYVPDALFIFLGHNDYNSVKNPTINQFVTGYVRMLEKITKDFMIYAGQGTKIINICDGGYNKELCYNVKTAVKDFSYSYDFVYYLELPPGTYTKQQLGCIQHPNSQGQRNIAKALYPHIRSILSK